MKFTTIVCVLATAVGAQAYGVPDCAGDCIKGYGGCNAYDYRCICSNTEFINNLSCCVSKSCDHKDQELTLAFAHKLCNKEGGITDIPTAATCASTATASGASKTSHVTSTITSKTSVKSNTGASSPTAATSTQGSGASGNGNKFGLGKVVAGLIAGL